MVTHVDQTWNSLLPGLIILNQRLEKLELFENCIDGVIEKANYRESRDVQKY